MTGFFYITALALLTTHELDAVARHEWRIFPLLNKLDGQLGATIFIAIHIPLFWAIFWFSRHPDQALREPFRTGFAAFCVIHVILHILLSRHPANEFNNPMSQLLIWSCGAAGAVYLGLMLWGGQKHSPAVGFFPQTSSLEYRPCQQEARRFAPPRFRITPV